MKILRIIYDFADPNVTAEGLSTGPYELTLSQSKLSDQIYVLTGNLNGTNLLKRLFAYNIGSNVRVYNLPRALKYFGPFLTSSVCVLPYYFYFRLFKKIDVVHTQQQMGVWFLLYKWLVGSLDPIPVVHTNHAVAIARQAKSLEQGDVYKFWTRNFQYPIHKFSDWLACRVAKTIIAVSQNAKAEIIQYYKPKSPIVIIENGANTDKFKREGETYDFGFPKTAKILLQWGRLSKRKNLDLLVLALTHLPPNYVLACWGEWDSQFKETVQTLINQHNLKSRVYDFNKSIPYWVIDKYVRSGHFFVLPSVHEGLPKVVIEALASGLKVLASGFKLQKPIPNLKYLSAIDPKTIAKELLELDTQPDAYQPTYDLIVNFYSWDKVARDVQGVYQGAVRG